MGPTASASGKLQFLCGALLPPGTFKDVIMHPRCEIVCAIQHAQAERQGCCPLTALGTVGDVCTPCRLADGLVPSCPHACAWVQRALCNNHVGNEHDELNRHVGPAAWAVRCCRLSLSTAASLQLWGWYGCCGAWALCWLSSWHSPGCGQHGHGGQSWRGCPSGWTPRCLRGRTGRVCGRPCLCS